MMEETKNGKRPVWSRDGETRNESGGDALAMPAELVSQKGKSQSQLQQFHPRSGIRSGHGLTGEVFACPSRNFSVAFHTTAKARIHNRPLPRNKYSSAGCSVEQLEEEIEAFWLASEMA
jgi:hypothetical protein